MFSPLTSAFRESAAPLPCSRYSDSAALHAGQTYALDVQDSWVKARPVSSALRIALEAARAWGFARASNGKEAKTPGGRDPEHTLSRSALFSGSRRAWASARHRSRYAGASGSLPLLPPNADSTAASIAAASAAAAASVMTANVASSREAARTQAVLCTSGSLSVAPPALPLPVTIRLASMAAAESALQAATIVSARSLRTLARTPMTPADASTSGSGRRSPGSADSLATRSCVLGAPAG